MNTLLSGYNTSKESLSLYADFSTCSKPDFVKETGVDINRPNAETAERDERGNILVAITATNEIWIDKRRVDLKAVRANIERLKIEYPEGSVIIQADKESRSGLLVEAMDQIRLAGVQNISIAAKNDS